MLVVGIDPGSRHLGWGVVRAQGHRIVHVAHGVIDAQERAPLADRLVILDDGLRRVLSEHAPVEAGVEALFFAKNAQSAATLGHARGVVLLALSRQGVRISEYPPAVVKRAVAANGRAEKAQVALMVRAILGLATIPVADAADALAIAITHIQSAPARRIAAVMQR